MSDLRFALRQLVKSPGFTAIAVLTLALGIGANTAIYSVINAALVRPLPYPSPSRLVEIWSHGATAPFPRTTGPRLKQWREHATSFEAIAGIHDRYARNLIDAGRADRVVGAQVSANYLEVLRVSPLLGRDFAPGEDRIGFENRVVILTHDWWQSRFGGDRTIIGRTLNFNRQSFTIIGVLPPRALPNDGLNFLMPLVLNAEPWRMDVLNPCVTARLKPDVPFAVAEAELVALAAELETRTLPDRQSWGTRVRAMQQVLVERRVPRSSFSWPPWGSCF